jgi:hypothetical protein
MILSSLGSFPKFNRAAKHIAPETAAVTALRVCRANRLIQRPLKQAGQQARQMKRHCEPAGFPLRWSPEVERRVTKLVKICPTDS